MRFRTLLSLAILVPLLVTGLAVMLQMYASADRNAADVGSRLLVSVAAQAAQQVHDRSTQAVNLAESLKGLAGDGLALDDSDRLSAQLLPVLRANPGITWITFSNPAGGFTGVYRDAQSRLCTNQSTIVDGNTAVVEYRVDDAGGRELIRRDADSGYDPRNRPFYIKAIAAPGIVWTDPYVFFNQRIPGISCAVAIRSQGKLIGVLSIDYDLRYLSEFARQARASPHSQIIVFAPDRLLIAHSDAAVIAANGTGNGKLISLSDLRDPLTVDFAGALPRFQPEVKADRMSFGFRSAGHPYLACVLPMALESGPEYFVATIAPKGDFAPSPWESSRSAFFVVAVVLLVAAVFALGVAKKISSPLIGLVRASQQIGKGDLDVKINLGRLHEYRHLADSLHRMQTNLRDWIRVRASLNLAMEIQRRLLPAAPPEIPNFDIAGYSAYCDETGGDYYDYLMIDPASPSQFLVALGDVMGHGLPSALLMAGARGILRASMAAQKNPAGLLAHMNELLHRDTNGDSFMTMLLVCFDIHGNACTWGSAGHDPLIIFDPTTKAFYEPEGGDIPLGITGETDYANYQFGPISAGQIIFIGSDGVWEMANEAGDQFGKDRLKALLADHSSGTSEEIKAAMLHALSQFRGQAAVKDDVTFVVLRRR